MYNIIKKNYIYKNIFIFKLAAIFNQLYIMRSLPRHSKVYEVCRNLTAI